MSDVFISYCSANRLIAGSIREAFGQDLDIWWDQRIEAGQPYPDEIRARLFQAKSVVVLWTDESNHSDWVHCEAELAVQQKKYVPVVYRFKDVPDRYSQLQYIDMSDWTASPNHDAFRHLLSEVQKTIAYRQREELSGKLRIPVLQKDGRTKVRAFRPLDEFSDHNCPKLIVIPPGQFFMGTDDNATDDPAATAEERPPHLVQISKAFAVGKYPVVFSEWEWARNQDGGPPFIPPDNGWGGGFMPVTCMNWHDARRYADFLTDYTGQTYRLLSESEWEYVCRAGTTGAFGILDLGRDKTRYDARGVYAGSKRSPKLTAKDLKPTDVRNCAGNRFHVCGMHGNAWEWVEDHWHPAYSTEKPRDGSPWVDQGPGARSRDRVVRGGSFKSLPQHLRSAHRAHYHPRRRLATIGFRVARDLP